MASRTLVLLEDDLDGGTADQTVTFSLDGVSYEIDLSDANAEELRTILAPYVGGARRLNGRGTPRAAARSVDGAGDRTPVVPGTIVASRRAGGPARADRAQLAAIRDWARRRGLDVNDRGRIPAHILDQYNRGSGAAKDGTSA